MSDNNTGVATETSPATLEQSNATTFAASFDAAKSKAEAINSGNDVIQAIEERAAQTQPPVEKKTETQPAPTKESAAPSADSEFPVELMTGEKPVAEPVKDELDDIQPSAKMGAESRANFDALKQKAREARTEAAKFKAELEAIKTKPAIMADSEALKQAHDRIKEMEQMVERADFTMTPKYRAIVSERDQAIEDAKGYLAGTEINPNIIEAAASMTGSKRVAFLKEAGVDVETIASISPFLAHADRKERERGESLKQSSTLRAEYDAQAQQQQEAVKAAERAQEDRTFAAAGEQVSKVFEPFQKIAGADKWNAQVDALNSEAKEFFSGALPIEKMAEIAYYGVGARVIHRMFHAQRAELKALKEQLGKLKAAQPANGSSNGHASSTVAPEPRTPEELYAQRMSNFNSIMGR